MPAVCRGCCFSRALTASRHCFVLRSSTWPRNWQRLVSFLKPAPVPRGRFWKPNVQMRSTFRPTASFSSMPWAILFPMQFRTPLRAGGLLCGNGGRSGAEVEIAVSDTGDGIAEQHHDRIFDRFYRATMTGRETGDPLGGGRLGLGLSIVKSIAELHGGAVSMRSVSGSGTTFTVRLPAFKADAADVSVLRSSSELH